MQRRTLLIAGAGLFSVAGLGIWVLGPRAVEAVLASTLHRRLPYLNLDAQGVKDFAADHFAKLSAKRMSLQRLKYHVATSFSHSSKQFGYSSGPPRTRVEQAEDLLVETYLMSSDFFINGADESRLVKYVAYFDPMRACSNPFSRPVIV
jgi:hypothetical protein